MRKTKTSRFLGWLLALCMTVALLPTQALASSMDDDPTTWIAPDSQYTAPGKYPVYILLDYTNDDVCLGAAHTCKTGSTVSTDLKKATATSDGYVKYTCDNCGSWARNEIPKLTLSAFTLDPAYVSATTTGVEYSGNAYTVVYNVAPAFRRYVGASLDNRVSVTAPGSYSIIVSVDSGIYDHVELQMPERLLVLPKAVPWTASFDNKIYDGNSLLDGKTVTYRDVNGASVPAALSACQVKVENGELTMDTTAPVSPPRAARKAKAAQTQACLQIRSSSVFVLVADVVRLIGIKHAVEMIELVADGARKKSARDKRITVALAVAVNDFHLVGAQNLARLAPYGKAALIAVLFALLPDKYGVNKLKKALFHVDEHGADRHTHLRRGKPRAFGFFQRFLHVVQQRAKLFVEPRDVFAPFA